MFSEVGSPSVWMLGARSTLAEHMARRWTLAGRPFHAAVRPELDLADPSRLDSLAIPADVTHAVCFAGLTSLAACRADPELADACNHRGPARLARRLADRGIPLVFLSTNLVFDGARAAMEPAAPPAPHTVYGRSKADGEASVRVAGGRVVRLTKVWEPGLPRLVDWADSLRAGRPVEAFDDLRVAPVTADDAVDSIEAALGDPAGSIRHRSGAADVSWYGIALRIAERLGVSRHLVHRTSAAEAGIPPAERPTHTTLADPAARPLDRVLDEIFPPP